MCCGLLILVFLGPRIFGPIWWIFQPVRWQAAFNNFATGNLWWIWPILGIIFLPWTTIMYVIVAPGGVTGFDWVWLGLMLVVDIASYSGGLGRKRLPGYEGYQLTLNGFFTALAQLSGLLFVVSSMLAMGLSLAITQIIQPLKNTRLVILALLANFVLVPSLAYLILLVIPLEQSLGIGLIVLATAAGAPFLPKLVQGAKGDIAFGVGLMVLLMVVTIAYIPIVLPLLLTGVQVNPWDIAQSLIVLMLIPLAIGLLMKSHSPEDADRWQPVMNKISSLAILILLVVGLGLNISNILSLIGTGGLLAMLLFILGSLVIGLLLGGRGPAIRSVMGLGTAQRNVSAAIVVAAQNFPEGNTLTFILVAAILLLLILLPTAKRMGGRSQLSSADDGAAPPMVEAD